MLVPGPWEGENWYPSFDRFMTEVYPNWREYYNVTYSTAQEIEELAEKLGPLPGEYVDFLTHMGGRGLDLRNRARLYSLAETFLTEDEGVYLNIGSYAPYDDGDRLAYRLTREGPPLLVWRERMAGGRPVKAADSLGQLLCNQAFLAGGVDQLTLRYPMELAFHLHQPPSGPCPEAEEYVRTHSLEGLSEEDLWDRGFQIQIARLEGPLREQGYKKAGFSTELDQIWIRGETCCILSREFDPNDMFDTVNISTWGMEGRPMWELAEAFKELGYGNRLELREGSHPAFRGI